MEEVFFMVEESEEGSLIAKGLGISIFTQAETLEELRGQVKDAVIVILMMIKKESFACTQFVKK